MKTPQPPPHPLSCPLALWLTFQPHEGHFLKSCSSRVVVVVVVRGEVGWGGTEDNDLDATAPLLAS